MMQSIFRHLLVCMALSAMMFVTVGCEKVNETRARRLANKAVGYMRDQQYSQAVNFLRQALQLNPRDGHIRYLLGRTYEFMTDNMKAEEEYKRAAYVDAKNYKPHFQLGGIYFKWKKYELASASYEKALALNPTHKLAMYQLGLSYHKQRRFPAAEAQFKKVIAADSKFIDAYNNLALVYYDQGEKARLELGDDQAVPVYEKVVSIVTQAEQAGVANEQSFNTMGLAYQKQKKFEQALQAFDKATKAKPYFSIAAYNRGATYDLWLEEMLKSAKEEKDKSKIKEWADKAGQYRDLAIAAFKKFLQLHQGNQDMRTNVREKIMKLKLMQEKEMFKRINRERREMRRKRR